MQARSRGHGNSPSCFNLDRAGLSPPARLIETNLRGQGLSLPPNPPPRKFTWSQLQHTGPFFPPAPPAASLLFGKSALLTPCLRVPAVTACDAIAGPVDRVTTEAFCGLRFAQRRERARRRGTGELVGEAERAGPGPGSRCSPGRESRGRRGREKRPAAPRAGPSCHAGRRPSGSRGPRSWPRRYHKPSGNPAFPGRGASSFRAPGSVPAPPPYRG